MTELKKQLLSKQIQSLISAAEILRASHERCLTIGIRSGLDDEQLEGFEALTARFARLSDMITQQILRSIDTLDLEDSGTVRDRINRAEKKGLIGSAEEFVQIRMLRNEIAHEYKAETILEIFERVLALIPALLQAVENIKHYVGDHFEILIR